MNTQEFIVLLEQLDDESWRALTHGQDLILLDDSRLEIASSLLPNAIITVSDTDVGFEKLKQQSLEQAAHILENYYLTHPLTLSGFNQQVGKLFAQYGEAAFAAPSGQLPERSLFVEVGEVLAEGRDSPRHRYGAFFEIVRPLQGDALIHAVRKWVESGAAHERYLEMNVCRYNC